MSGVSKKYVKALVSLYDNDGLQELYTKLREVSLAYSSQKLKTILYSNDIANDKKVEFLLSLIDNPDEKTQNLFKLLASYNRLELLPSICDELEYQVAKLTNVHSGTVFSNLDLSEDKVEEIAKKLSSKFNTNINLGVKRSDYNGIKVEVDTLGIEVAFSTDRLKDQLKTYILKSI